MYSADTQLDCFHCGETCVTDSISADEKHFCCEGCKMVYQLLNQSGLCDYYQLNEMPGVNQRMPVRTDKFAFLDDSKIEKQLISFKDVQQTNISFYLPQIHCSSCLYLLEHLHTLEEGIISSVVNFTRKEVDIVFDHTVLSLRKVAELLTSIGYEPYISLQSGQSQKVRTNKQLLYRLGVAGFCFANIMLLSFPEYLGLEDADKHLLVVFRSLNLLLAMPVFLYSAFPFFKSGYKGLQQRFLNIDAPIALAILVTFTRSVYEVVGGTGSGYFDSMSGIVFFMLAGRVLQDKTWQQLSFERDFTSYFPIAAVKIDNGKELPVPLAEIKAGDTIRIHSNELIPADGICTRGKACIDYSFVTGESLPVNKDIGEMVYAGGKQVGGAIEILVRKEVTQSYLTRLWAKDEFKQEAKSVSFVHMISRWFTYILLTIAGIAAIYWYAQDSTRVWNVVTAVLIVACPCALLLSNTFTNGNILRILAKRQLYLRSAQTIEDMAGITHVVFDKTGTLTTTATQEVTFHGNPLTKAQQMLVASVAGQSNHPLSRALVAHLPQSYRLPPSYFLEHAGNGIEAIVENEPVLLGSQQFVTGKVSQGHDGPSVFVAIGGRLLGHFSFKSHYRQHVHKMVQDLSKRYRLSVLSGDHDAEKETLERLIGANATLLFNQQPEDKLYYIRSLQQKGERVMMVGDGLNDAGALKQSDAGIALTENTNNFTPASDAIMQAAQLKKLPVFIRICKANRQIVLASFMVSILYNIIGIGLAVQGLVSPMAAAILMPASSLSILLVTFGSSNLLAKWLK